MSQLPRTMSLKLFQNASGEVIADRPPGRTTILPTGGVESVSAPQDENDYDAEIFEGNRPSVEAVRRVAWARNDRASPCYSHLLVDGGDTLKVAPAFELGKAEMELLLGANRAIPVGHYDVVAFGLRGARLRGAAKFENVDRLPLEDARPDHVHFQCVIGFYFRGLNNGLGKFSAYTASTVPWHEYMSAGKKLNLLPTGCYVYKKGEHHPSEVHRVNPALRLSDADGADSGLATVLRPRGQLGFDLESAWSIGHPSDNIHCAYSDAKFSSLGCQTVKGTMHDGLWADFQTTIKTLPAGGRVDYTLFTGAEASIAWSLLKDGAQPSASEVLRRLGRLRAGSEGEEVNRLQAALGVQVTGYFGASTKMKLTEVQAQRGLAPDGIFSPDMDMRLGWKVFAGSSSAMPAAVVAAAAAPVVVATAEAVARAPQDASSAGPLAGSGAAIPLTRELISRIAPRPKRASEAAIWDTYVGALTSPEGAAIMTSYGVTTPQRQSFILANMLAETGGLSLIWESMNYSAERLLTVFHAARISPEEAAQIAHNPEKVAERVYGTQRPGHFASDMGNTHPGDGFRYRGGGFLQTTGRDNYRKIGKQIGEDLEGHPELIENPLISLKAACAEWQQVGLNEQADRGSFRACCKGINFGNIHLKAEPEGMDRRLRYLKKAADAFAIPVPRPMPGALESTAGGGLELGDMGSDVTSVQRDLNALGYDVGVPDGIFTTRTRDAVLEFQARNGLPITGRVDAETGTVLASADAIAKSNDTAGGETAAEPEAVTQRRVPGAGRHGRRGWIGSLAFASFAVLGIFAMLAASGVFGHQVTQMPVISTLAVEWFEPLAFGGWLLALTAGLKRLVFG